MLSRYFYPHNDRVLAGRDEITKGWTLEKVFTLWEKTMAEAGVDPQQPLFEKRRLFAADKYQQQWWLRRHGLFWWSASEAVSNFGRLQVEVGGILPAYELLGGEAPDDYLHGAGVGGTLEMLWQLRHDRKKVIALLLCSALFNQLHSTRSRGSLLSYECIALLDWLDRLAACYLKNDQLCGWHYACKDVTPDSLVLEGEFLTVKKLVVTIARHYAWLLQTYQPYAAVYGQIKDPEIFSWVEQRCLRLSRQNERQLERQRIQREQYDEALRQLKLKHPRYGEWERLSSDELRQMAQMQTPGEIALLFGTTPSIVGKRCRSLKISKPPTYRLLKQRAVAAQKAVVDDDKNQAGA